MKTVGCDTISSSKPIWDTSGIRLFTVIMHVSLGGPDYASIKFLKKWPRGFYISPLVNNFDGELQRFLTEQYFKSGAALFGHQTPLELQEVRAWARGYLDECSDNQVYQLVQYFVQRVRNYTHIRALSDAMIEWAHSTRECHTVKYINVEEARLAIRTFRQMTIGDYGVKVYGKDMGFPPFDLDCRCRMEGVIPGVDCR